MTKYTIAYQIARLTGSGRRMLARLTHFAEKRCLPTNLNTRKRQTIAKESMIGKSIVQRRDGTASKHRIKVSNHNTKSSKGVYMSVNAIATRLVANLERKLIVV